MRSSKLVRLIVMSVMLCCTSATATSTAHGWTTNGPLGFTATAGTVVFTIHASSAAALSCSGSWAPGNRAVGTLNGSGPATPFDAGPVTFSFTGCINAATGTPMTCQPARLWLTSYAPPVATGEIRGLDCGLSLPGCVVRFTGSGPNGRAFHVTYDNSTGRLTLLNAMPPHPQQQSVATAWVGCAWLIPSSGTAPGRWSSTGGTSVLYTMTSTPAPAITNP